MSKDAALMAFGYPPTIRTATTEMDNWTYWKNRWDTMVVTFADGKINTIRD